MADKSDFNLSKKLRDILNTQLHRSSWPYKFGNHIEERIGLINFSIIGTELEATVGGQISIDIYPKENNKK